MTEQIREFATGANRNTDIGKFDYDGFLSPLSIEAFGAYMNFNRHLEDGSLRDSDNWQKGIPLEVYRKSLWRHHFDTWRALRGYDTPEGVIWSLCGMLFNAQGILHELLKAKPELLDEAIAAAEQRRNGDVQRHTPESAQQETNPPKASDALRPDAPFLPPSEIIPW